MWRYVKEIDNRKCVILYLVRNSKRDIKDLKKSLNCLDINFNNSYNYPVIVFNEDFTNATMEDIKKSTSSEIIFQRVIFKVPEFLNMNEVSDYVYIDNSPYSIGFSIGYRHMCRFFAGKIYDCPILKGYEYYWRLDAHSYILEKIDYDIFEFMKDNDILYGYIDSGKDITNTDSLWIVTKKYLEDKNIKYDKTWDGIAYGTNFEISSFEFWRSNEYKNYFDYIDRIGGIYKYRWGDHIIHYLAISIFVSEQRLYKFTDIAYQHNKDVYNYIQKVHVLTKLVQPITSVVYLQLLRVSSLLKRKSKMYRNFRDGT